MISLEAGVGFGVKSEVTHEKKKGDKVYGK